MSGPETASADGVSPPGTEADNALALLEEQLTVERRAVQGETIRVATTTQLRQQHVEEQLARETIEIERVAIGRVVEAAPDIRQEGDTTVVPILEEVLVLERRLLLKEEVRIRRVRTTEIHRETVQLREQAAVITRTKPGQLANSAITSDSTSLAKREIS